MIMVGDLAQAGKRKKKFLTVVFYFTLNVCKCCLFHEKVDQY